MEISKLLPVFIGYLKVEKKYSVHTCISYENDITGFGQYCLKEYETDEIQRINHIQIRSWIVSLMANGLGAASANRKISAMRSFYKWMQRKEHVAINPMSKILAPKKPKKLPITVHDANINRLIEPDLVNINDNEYEVCRDAFIIELLYSTGIRRAELVGLLLSDFNVERQEVRVKGKGNKIRSIPLTEGILASFQKYVNERDLVNVNFSSQLLLTKDGKPIYPRLVHTIVAQKLASVTTLSKKSPHVLRHSFATHMLDRGADINAIKEILGHANLAATQVYTHSSIAKLKDAYMKAHPRSNEN
ncbi:MAG: tyrosine-type recombinase/integrase [Saprospiraceae bacterium]